MDEHSAPAPIEIFSAPAPVIEHVAQAPALTYAVAEHVAPAPAVSYAAEARIVEDIAPTPVPASAFQVDDMGYDVSCENIRLGYGVFKYQIRVLKPHDNPSSWAAGECIVTCTSALTPSARALTLGASDGVDSGRDGESSEPRAVYKYWAHDRAWRACGPLRAWPRLQRGRVPSPGSAGTDSRLARFSLDARSA